MSALRPTTGWLILLLACPGCARERTPPGYPPPPGPGEFSVMTYNLHRFGLADRDGDGQEDDAKPQEEVAAVVTILCHARPDILALQEVGDEQELARLAGWLRDAGVEYPHSHFVAGPSRHRNLAVLSRFPLVNPMAVTNLTYSIRDQAFPVQRGFQQVDIVVSPSFTLRLIHAHLKTKTFHEAGQTEMRRNEARLLATLARRNHREAPQRALLVCGDFSDTELSAALRELTGGANAVLLDLAIKDRHGDGWTRDDRNESAYTRSDYLLVNDMLAARWREGKSAVIRDQPARLASEHRPVLATFTAKD